MNQRAQLEAVQRLNPGIEFRQGDMHSPDIEDAAWGGIVAFYSIIHVPRSRIAAALAEMRRVLRPCSPPLRPTESSAPPSPRRAA